MKLDSTITRPTREEILRVLAKVAETPELNQKLDLRLFDLAIMDSFKLVELIVAFCEAFELEISPADLNREQWATPRLIAIDIERRLAARPG